MYFVGYHFKYFSFILKRYVVDYVSSMIHNLEQSKSEKPIFMWSNFIDAHEPGRMCLI